MITRFKLMQNKNTIIYYYFCIEIIINELVYDNIIQ